MRLRALLLSLGILFGLVPPLVLPGWVSWTLFGTVVIALIFGHGMKWFRYYSLAGFLLLLEFSWMVLKLEGILAAIAALFGGTGAYLVFELGYILSRLSVEPPSSTAVYEFDIHQVPFRRLLCSLLRRIVAIQAAAALLYGLLAAATRRAALAGDWYFFILIASIIGIGCVLHKLVRGLN